MESRKRASAKVERRKWSLLRNRVFFARRPPPPPPPPPPLLYRHTLRVCVYVCVCVCVEIFEAPFPFFFFFFADGQTRPTVREARERDERIPRRRIRRREPRGFCCLLPFCVGNVGKREAAKMRSRRARVEAQSGAV